MPCGISIALLLTSSCKAFRDTPAPVLSLLSQNLTTFSYHFDLSHSAANDARKYLCLARYDVDIGPLFNVTNLGLVDYFVTHAKQQMKWVKIVCQINCQNHTIFE